MTRAEKTLALPGTVPVEPEPDRHEAWHYGAGWAVIYGSRIVGGLALVALLWVMWP